MLHISRLLYHSMWNRLYQPCDQEWNYSKNFHWIWIMMEKILMKWVLCDHGITGIILGTGSANERRRSYVTPSLIGGVHSQKTPTLYVPWIHYSDVIMRAMTSQITCISIVCSTICWGADQRNFKALHNKTPVTSGFPSQRASNTENISNRWHHYVHL